MQRKKANEEKAAAAVEGSTASGKRQSSRTIVVSRAMRIVSSEARQEVRDKRLQQLEADNYQEEQTGEDEAYSESDEDTGASQKKKKMKTGKRNSKANTARAAHKNRSFERVVMDQGYYTDPVRRNASSESAAISRGVKSSTKNSSTSSSSSSSSSSGKYSQNIPGDGLHRQNNDLEWSDPGSLATSSVNYCNVYINTSNSSTASASIDLSMDDNSLLPYLSIAALPSKSSTRYFCSVCGYFGTYTCTRCGCRFCCTKCLLSHKETRCLKFSY